MATRNRGLWCAVLAFVFLAASLVKPTNVTSAEQNIVPPEILFASMTSIKFTDIKDHKIDVTLKLSGKPDCDGWYQKIGTLRWERLSQADFKCSTTDKNEFSLNASSLTPKYISVYGIRFNNSKGACYFQFEIKGEEDLWNSAVVVSAISVSGAVIVVVIILISVFVCRRRRSRENRRHENYQDMSMSGGLTRSSSTTSSSRSAAVCRTPSCRTARPQTPAKPPKSFRRSSLPDCSKTAPCDDTSGGQGVWGSAESLQPPWYGDKGGTENYEPQRSLQHMRPRPPPRVRVVVDGSTMMNRRMSRSVPSLFSNQPPGNLTLPSRSGRGRYPQCPMLPAFFQKGPQVRPEDLNAFLSRRNEIDQDSGIGQGPCANLWEEDDAGSELASVSVVDSFRRRRNSSDVGHCRYLRRSLEITSERLRTSKDRESRQVDRFEDVFPQHQTGSQPSTKSDKYMSMSSFYRGPQTLPQADHRRPTPPPRGCGTMDGMHIYENMDGLLSENSGGRVRDHFF